MAELKLFNTMGRRTEVFVPSNGVVKMYVCGITPYDTTHLGHARTFIVFDVLHRLFLRLGWQVRYIQNVTDIDDPLFERARALGVSYQELADRYTRVYFQDMAALNVLPPERYTYASQEMDDIEKVVAGLHARGYAYSAAGYVYFRVSYFPRYGVLSRLSRDEMLRLAAEAGEDPSDPRKEDPLDFYLWKPSAADEPSWDTPWGRGRPGWHIECSSMALKYLGPTLDLHGGGADLIYPHHENEIAQSESYTGVSPFARFWVHVGMVTLYGTKMSKSLGNMVMVDDLLARYSPEAVRLYLLHFPYRERLEYIDGAIDPFQAIAERVAESIRCVQPESNPLTTELVAKAMNALCDDLYTPRAVVLLREWADRIQVSSSVDAAGLAAAILEVGEVLGLQLGGHKA